MQEDELNFKISAAFAAAFVEVQKIMENPAKTHIADAGSYKYKYAGLDDSMACVKAALNANDITVTQPTLTDEAGRVGVKTVLTYKTGEMWDLGTLMMKVSDDPQKVGSALSYMRRYCLTSGVGQVAEEDDDGAGAKKAAEKAKKKTETKKKPAGGSTTGQQTTSTKRKPQQHIDSVKAHFKFYETKYDFDRAQTELINASEFEKKDDKGKGTGVMVPGYMTPTEMEDKAVKNGLSASAYRLQVICHNLEAAWKKDLEVKVGD